MFQRQQSRQNCFQVLDLLSKVISFPSNTCSTWKHLNTGIFNNFVLWLTGLLYRSRESWKHRQIPSRLFHWESKNACNRVSTVSETIAGRFVFLTLQSTRRRAGSSCTIWFNSVAFRAANKTLVTFLDTPVDLQTVMMPQWWVQIPL